MGRGPDRYRVGVKRASPPETGSLFSHGTVHLNRIAGDDDPLTLMRLAVRPLVQPPFSRSALETEDGSRDGRDSALAARRGVFRGGNHQTHPRRCVPNASALVSMARGGAR
jgi:hypothetical protein